MMRNSHLIENMFRKYNSKCVGNMNVKKKNKKIHENTKNNLGLMKPKTLILPCLSAKSSVLVKLMLEIFL